MNRDWQVVYVNAEKVWNQYVVGSRQYRPTTAENVPYLARLFDARLTGWDKEWLKRLRIKI